MTVVVGVDGSPPSRAALRLAAQEARWRQVALVAVSAYEPPLGAPAGGYPIGASHTGDDKRATAESTLRDTVNKELGDQAGQTDLRVSGGLAGRVIVETARQTHAQLIVLAASPGKSVVPGTVSHYVLLKAECPVMVVPGSSPAAAAGRPAEGGGPRMTTAAGTQQQPIRSTIPARLDRLRWSPFHTRLVLGLGTAWVLDGLSVTIASSVTSKLTQPDTLNLTTTQAASIGTVYLVGEVIGALVFGRLSDKLGRRKLFMWTLAVYLVGTGLTALTPKGTRLDRLPVRDPVHRRHGHRRRVLGHQLGHRRDDARPLPRAHRYLDQRHLLARGHHRHAHFVPAAQLAAAERGLADGFPGRPGAGLRDLVRAAQPPGEPAVADHPRP